MEKHRIVIRTQCGKLQKSNKVEEDIHKSVAIHLGLLKRSFDSGLLLEDDVFNMDETHFVINMDNGQTLGFIGDEDVKYADVVSGGVGMTMVVMIRGGKWGKVEVPMLIFMNENRSYPIQGVPDNIPGVCYRSGPKGWMDKTVFPMWLRENRILQTNCDRRRVIFMDNCGGHNETADSVAALNRINSSIAKLPPNSTHLCQPADSFVISKLKTFWTRIWDLKKLELMNDNHWTKSGKLPNPGKTFF